MSTTFVTQVLVYPEGDSFVALALEMDVRGHGVDRSTALADLLEMLQAQVSYAVQMRHPESVWKPASEVYWQMFEEARKQQLFAALSGATVQGDHTADIVPLPEILLDQRFAAYAGV